jgi:hypothetical protein
MPIPLQTKLSIFEAQNEHYSNQSHLLDASFVYLLCLCAFSGKANTVLCNQKEIRVRVPAIVFDYPRHSGATDEGMTNRPLIFTYLVFGLGGITVEEIARPIKTAAERGPGATLGVQARIQRVQVGLAFD